MDEQLFIVEIKIKDEIKTIEVFKDDEPERLADNFCLENYLDEGSYEKIVYIIKKKLKEIKNGTYNENINFYKNNNNEEKKDEFQNNDNEENVNKILENKKYVVKNENIINEENKNEENDVYSNEKNIN